MYSLNENSAFSFNEYKNYADKKNLITWNVLNDESYALYICYEIEYSIIEYSIFHDSQKYKIKKINYIYLWKIDC